MMKMIVMSEFRCGKSNFHWCSTTDFIKKCTYYAIKVYIYVLHGMRWPADPSKRLYNNSIVCACAAPVWQEGPTF